MLAQIDVLADDLASQEGTCCFGTHDHLRTCTEYGVDKGIEDEGIKAVDWGNVT